MTELMRRRRALMAAQGGSTPILPAEYQQVEYIEATNAPYISTGVTATLDTVVMCLFKITTNQSTAVSYPAIFGQTNPTFGLTYQKANLSNAYVTVGNSGEKNIASTGFASDFSEIEVSRYSLKINGTHKININATSLTPGNLPILVFGRNKSNDYRPGAMQCKYFKIYQNGILVCHLVPCYRKSDDVIGMYDLVQQAFRTNIGTGAFTKGGNV